jgi:perosamine synthetase
MSVDEQNQGQSVTRNGNGSLRQVLWESPSSSGGTERSRREIPVAMPSLDGNEAKYVLDCVTSGWVSSRGQYVDRFEADFAAFCGVSDAISCSNGTAALHLALVALGVGPGSEVIVPSLTYIATANAVRYCGATPVFVDSDPNTMNLDPAGVERSITARTKVIIPVHLYGQCADMGPILKMARSAEIAVVEDAAEAHGATYRGRYAGSMGTIGAFSFFGNKIFTTGEGGMVTLNDNALADRIRGLRDQGADPSHRYWHSVIGFNYRMTNLQAALGVAQLERADEFLEARAAIAAWYDDELADLHDLLILPRAVPGNRHVYWMYTVRLRDQVDLTRDEVMYRLDADGVDTRPSFSPVHLMPPYVTPAYHLPVAEAIGARGITLPTYSELSRDDVAYVASRLRAHLHR